MRTNVATFVLTDHACDITFAGMDGPPLDDHQYTVAGLASYEAIYGRDFVSPGGRQTTAEILAKLQWPPGTTVIDVGCGLGGAAFMMATSHSAHVLGIDLSHNMIEEASKRCQAHGLDDRVTLVHGNILDLDLAHQFDIVHSREVFLHVHDKLRLFSMLDRALKPGGQLLFTDYCRGPDEPSEAFRVYMDEFGYDLRTVSDMEALLVEAGFDDVVGTDQTQEFIEIHRRELERLPDSGLSAAEQEQLRVGWLAKIDRARSGEQRWGLFQARASSMDE